MDTPTSTEATPSLASSNDTKRGLLEKMRSVRGPKLKVRSSLGELRLKKKTPNEVFRSNSFRFEKYEMDQDQQQHLANGAGDFAGRNKVGKMMLIIMSNY